MLNTPTQCSRRAQNIVITVASTLIVDLHAANFLESFSECFRRAVFIDGLHNCSIYPNLFTCSQLDVKKESPVCSVCAQCLLHPQP